MNLRQLRIFYTVCRTGSMTEAARKLFMSQPAVSQTISDLENRLGVKLFERLNRRLVLTVAGQNLISYARRILILTDEAEKTIRDINNINQGRLRIGASMTIGTYLLPEIIDKFSHDYQQVDISLLIDNTSVIESKTLNNEIDLGLVEGPIGSDNIIVKFYFDDELCLICSPEHEWVKQSIQEISSIQIATENFIMREKGSGTRTVIENTMSKNNIEYNTAHVLNNIEAIKKAVSANLGVSILPEIAVKEEISCKNLYKIKIKDVSFKRKFNIIYHKDKYQSQLFKKFIEYL